jgi:hypothetical protein
VSWAKNQIVVDDTVIIWTGNLGDSSKVLGVYPIRKEIKLVWSV